jgi:solute carrier family 30 (zinc transporter), member 9
MWRASHTSLRALRCAASQHLDGAWQVAVHTDRRQQSGQEPASVTTQRRSADSQLHSVCPQPLPLPTLLAHRGYTKLSPQGLLPWACRPKTSSQVDHAASFHSSSASQQTAPSQMSELEQGQMHAVHTAIACNVAILAAKMGVYTISGSNSILAEGIHSAADIANQLLLRMGVASSLRAPDDRSNYGYRRELFVWSLISGVGIFCLGAGVTIVHGVNSFFDPPELEHVTATLAVVAVSLVIESYSLLVAWRALAAGAAARGMSTRAYMTEAQDPTSMAIVAEDGAAVVGLAVAAMSLLAAEASGNAVYDAMGSVAVGTLLGMVAGWLIQTNRRALVGRALPRAQLDAILRALRADPVVSAVDDPKSEEVGPGEYRFKAEIEFHGDAVVSRYLDADHNRERLVAMFEAASITADRKAMDAALGEYGRRLVTAVGDEVDRLEAMIRAIEPSIKHVDIESS